MADDLNRAPDWSATGGEALLKAILDAPNVMAGVFEVLEDDYRYAVANRNTAAANGRADIVGLTGSDLGQPAEEIADGLRILKECVATGAPLTREYSFRPLGQDQWNWYLGTFSPLPGREPRVAFVVVDITAGRRAQATAEAHNTRLALAMEATGLGIWQYDIAADRVTWDPRMRELFGVTDAGSIDFAAYEGRIHPEDLPAVRDAYERALAGENEGRYVVQHRVLTADGSPRWIRGAARVLFNRSGAPVRVLGTGQDVTEQVSAAERQSLLLAELNHRVKNNLAAVQAIASQTLRANGDNPKAFREAFQGRLFSMARGHDLLTRNAWSAADLSDVLQAALSPFNPAPIRLEGPPGVPLQPDLAVNLVMVLHELAVNAAKYGALSREGGEVAIRWSVTDGVLELNWCERGGPPVAPPSRTGFGSRLTAVALRAFGGSATTRFDPEGLSCRLRTPLGPANGPVFPPG